MSDEARGFEGTGVTAKQLDDYITNAPEPDEREDPECPCDSCAEDCKQDENCDTFDSWKNPSDPEGEYWDQLYERRREQDW